VVSREELDKVLQERFDPDFDRWFQTPGNKYDVAKILLAAALGVGSSIAKLRAYTGYSRSFVTVVVNRLKENGLWSEWDFREWLHGREGVDDFWHCVYVGQGTELAEISEDTGELEYRSIGVPL
jgi:hypothetical protein